MFSSYLVQQLNDIVCLISAVARKERDLCDTPSYIAFPA